MSETSYYLNSQRGEPQPERKPKWEDGSSETDDGPPIWLCAQCQKKMEGSWNGLKSYPYCERGKGCYVAHAVAWSPKGMIVLLGLNTPFRDKKNVCSEECAKRLDPDGKLERFPQ